MTDHNAPAAKADIEATKECVAKLYDANERWKNEILDAMDRKQDEITQHFEVAALRGSGREHSPRRRRREP